MISDSHSEFGGVRRMEVVQTGRRRRWSHEQKLRIVEEATAGGVSLLSIARRHEVDPGQIYTWRKMLRGLGSSLPNEGFAAVMVSRDGLSAQGTGRMEIQCRSGRKITVGRDVDVAILVQVVAALDR